MKYALIRRMDISNGPGIRVSLFVSGCNSNCIGCFNKEAQDYDYGQEYTEETKQLILNEVNKPHIQGLSILGGDALWQNLDGLRQIAELCESVHYNKDIWLWTGFTWEEIMDKDWRESNYIAAMQRVVQACDVLIDGKFVYSKKDLSLQYRGSSNQRVINIQESIKQKHIVLFE